MSNHIAALAKELQPGEIYRVKLTSGAWVEARYNEWHSTQYAGRRTTTHYHFTNLKSGRTITVKSRAKIRGLANGQ